MKNKHKIRTEILYKTFIYVALISLAVSIIVPVGWVFLASIKQNKEFYGSPWSMPERFYVKNFVSAFNEAKMGEYMLNSIYTTFVGLFLLLVVSIPAAYVLARYTFKGRAFLQGLLKAGLFINVSYIVIPIFLMLLNGDQLARELIGDGFLLNNLTILSLVYASTALPFTIYLLSSYFETLPKGFEEAAFMDGAGYFKTMIKVMIPMAKPSIITVILFNFLAFWNEYIIALTLIPGENKTLPVGLMDLMTAQRAAANYGQMYAGMVIVMLPTLILYILVQKRLTEGMTLGGLKG